MRELFEQAESDVNLMRFRGRGREEGGKEGEKGERDVQRMGEVERERGVE